VVVHTPAVHVPVVKPAQTAAHSLSYVAPLTHTGSHTSGHIHGVVVEVATPAAGVVEAVSGCVDTVVPSTGCVVTTAGCVVTTVGCVVLVVVVTGSVDAVVHCSMRWPDGSYHSA
jgi:hypothetical protein